MQLLNDSKAREQLSVLNHVIWVAEHMVSASKTERFSVKVRSLVKYGYIAYVRRTMDFNVLRGLTRKVEPPGYIANKFFYRRVEEELGKRFHVRFENRKGIRYVVFLSRSRK